MFNRFSTRNLLITFVVLLVLVLITIPSGNKKNRSFRSQLSDFAKEEVSTFRISPPEGGPGIGFTKQGDTWMVGDGSGEYNADDRQVEQLLESLSGLKAKRLAGKGKDSWDKYELSDSLCTRVEVLKGGKTLAEVYIGKFSYTPPSGPANPYQQAQGTMTSYVRIGKDREVYAVDGFLSMSFNRPLKEIRDSRVLEVEESSLARIAVMQDGQAYSLTRNGQAWLIDGIQADSAAMASWLNGLSYLRSNHFLPVEEAPAGQPSHQLTLEGEGGSLMARVDAWYTDSTHIQITSSVNPGTWFDGSQNGLFDKLFTERTSLGSF